MLLLNDTGVQIKAFFLLNHLSPVAWTVFSSLFCKALCQVSGCLEDMLNQFLFWKIRN